MEDLDSDLSALCVRASFRYFNEFTHLLTMRLQREIKSHTSLGVICEPSVQWVPLTTLWRDLGLKQAVPIECPS